MRSSELLAPAGDFETALAAFEAGADAVYCGLADFSARAFAKNFTQDDLRRLMRYARVKGRRVYVTFNTLLDEDQLEGAVETLAALEEIGPDALIVQDLGVARLCRAHFPGLALHASTQLVAHNLEGVLALGELGFTRVVLARELSLDEISSIARRCGGIELECFIHGALCYSISGLCLFGAMEKDRSGNRGKCPYCCRLPYENAEGRKTLAFSMKDMRVGEDARRLVEAGVASLKIEGRMKSALYVASVVKWYRQILGEGRGLGDEGTRGLVTQADLETVFSRRTTELYLNGRPDAHKTPDMRRPSPIDPTSLGHLGTPIGTVKRVTKDREGQRWLRFHTARALEKHDGLQFANPDGGKPLGLGIGEMRPAISRTPVFEVSAGTDVEIALPEEDLAIRPGDTVYCSMSNAVRRMFPAPSFRDSDYPGTIGLDVEVTIAAHRMSAMANGACVSVEGDFAAAQHPEKTFGAVEKAFAKLGGSDYRLNRLSLIDEDRRFAPASVLNDLRRDLVERIDAMRTKARRAKIEEALDGEDGAHEFREFARVGKVVKIRIGQSVPPREWGEVVMAVNADTTGEQLAAYGLQPSVCRLALPVYTAEPDFNRLRTSVKRLARTGFLKWEASDLATLRMLKQVGMTDITADWTLYAFNSRALAALSELGVKRFVASPENGRDNLQFLAESGYDVEMLAQQSTPLFISLTQPIAQTALAVYRRDGLWVTTRPVPRTFPVPAGASERCDLSWDVS